MSLLEIIRTLWPIAAFTTPFILAGGFAWLKTQFPTKTDLENLRKDREVAVQGMRSEIAKEIALISVLARTTADRQIANEEKIAAIAEEARKRPTKDDLSKDIGKVAERLGRVEEGVSGLRRELGTHSSYLHSLLERKGTQ